MSACLSFFISARRFLRLIKSASDCKGPPARSSMAITVSAHKVLRHGTMILSFRFTMARDATQREMEHDREHCTTRGTPRRLAFTKTRSTLVSTPIEQHLDSGSGWLVAAANCTWSQLGTVCASERRRCAEGEVTLFSLFKRRNGKSNGTTLEDAQADQNDGERRSGRMRSHREWEPGKRGRRNQVQKKKKEEERAFLPRLLLLLPPLRRLVSRGVLAPADHDIPFS